MFLSFLNNYDIRGVNAQYLWVYYNQLYKINKKNINYLVNKDYIENYTPQQRWEVNSIHAKNMGYIPPNIIPENYILMDNYYNDTKPSSLILHKYINDININLVKEYSRIIVENNIKCGLTWVNNNSFKYALNIKNNIPLIHNELGALRSPIYKDTFYFDFSGVNGNTEFYERFNKFKEISSKVKIFSREELFKIISPNYFNELINYSNKNNNNLTGIPLQVENDTNILIYNNGWTLPDIVSYVEKKYSNFIIRNHPSSFLKYERYNFVDDESKNSAEFISKCNRIVTINSSVGFESLLLGRETEILGDNPFKTICYMDENDKILALNFAIFSYLVPIDKLYNLEYYRYRIECRDEFNLYKYGQNLWLK